MTLRQVRNGGEVERYWHSLSTFDEELGYEHTLQLAPGQTAMVELPDDFTDPHLVEVGSDGQDVPWPVPQSGGGVEADLPPAATSTPPDINPLPPVSATTAPDDTGTVPPPPQQPAGDSTTEE